MIRIYFQNDEGGELRPIIVDQDMAHQLSFYAEAASTDILTWARLARHGDIYGLSDNVKLIAINMRICKTAT